MAGLGVYIYTHIGAGKLQAQYTEIAYKAIRILITDTYWCNKNV